MLHVRQIRRDIFPHAMQPFPFSASQRPAIPAGTTQLAQHESINLVSVWP
jgi:hypothetical protein